MGFRILVKEGSTTRVHLSHLQRQDGSYLSSRIAGQLPSVSTLPPKEDAMLIHLWLTFACQISSKDLRAPSRLITVYVKFDHSPSGLFRTNVNK